MFKKKENPAKAPAKPSPKVDVQVLNRGFDEDDPLEPASAVISPAVMRASGLAPAPAPAKISSKTSSPKLTPGAGPTKAPSSPKSTWTPSLATPAPATPPPPQAVPKAAPKPTPPPALATPPSLNVPMVTADAAQALPLPPSFSPGSMPSTPRQWQPINFHDGLPRYAEFVPAEMEAALESARIGLI